MSYLEDCHKCNISEGGGASCRSCPFFHLGLRSILGLAGICLEGFGRPPGQHTRGDTPGQLTRFLVDHAAMKINLVARDASSDPRSRADEVLMDFARTMAVDLRGQH